MICLTFGQMVLAVLFVLVVVLGLKLIKKKGG